MADEIILNPADSVAILTARGVAPQGHKVALRTMAPGEAVIKYGQVIGYATAPISPGEHVHTHNMVFGEHGRDYAPGAGLAAAEAARDRFAGPQDSFLGYHRPGG
ncbi:altronate hydrolase [Paracoccus sanguinis]|uniref:Altronate hydrolase n=1 Tax=Paracoccus sanguinis TaxID=1545044 RepID=A0A1H3BA49_9RHOB|nr:UxaA family hydrolase [Paracoccus sanguinis]SDX37899.1 altronate hydrolase [Paracoccus sanguinis]